MVTKFMLGVFSICLFVAAPLHAQAFVTVSNEPHHKLIFSNAIVSVYQLHLKPDEVANLHQLPSFYDYLSLQPVIISNEVPDHTPVITKLDKGELRSSKGGFHVAERNTSSHSADIFVVTPHRLTGKGFPNELALPFSTGGAIEQFSGSAMRAYVMALPVDGKLKEFREDYDTLFIALDDLNIKNEITGKDPAPLNLKAGETYWIPQGTTYSLTSQSDHPIAMMVLEFN